MFTDTCSSYIDKWLGWQPSTEWYHLRYANIQFKLMKRSWSIPDHVTSAFKRQIKQESTGIWTLFLYKNTKRLLGFLRVCRIGLSENQVAYIRNKVYDGITCQKHATIVNSILLSHFNKAIYNLHRQTQSAVHITVKEQNANYTKRDAYVHLNRVHSNLSISRTHINP